MSSVKRRKVIEGMLEQSGEMEEGIEGCGRFCSELHDCYGSTYIINMMIARKIKHCTAQSITRVHLYSTVTNRGSSVQHSQ